MEHTAANDANNALYMNTLGWCECGAHSLWFGNPVLD